uniref:protein-disulfide reductase n=1 Tax=Cannabis sativa TaxID=3483 RepID=A0A803PFL1_CANSA
MATKDVDDVIHDLTALFSSDERDFLVRNNGDQVNISSLNGKIVGLYFSGSWFGPSYRFTPKLVELYNEVASKEEFELVFVSSDRDEESFNGYFSEMPWLAIPFSDTDTIDRLNDSFDIMGIPDLIIIDSDGKILTENGISVVLGYGVDAYPFSRERIEFLKEQEEEAKMNQTLSSILVSSSRNYLLSKDGKQVPASELEGKTVGLLFLSSQEPCVEFVEPRAEFSKPCVEFTNTLVEIYNKLKNKGEKFEVVLISLNFEEEEFKKGLEIIPWLALPYKDSTTVKLACYFDVTTLPTLVIIGPDGKTVNSNVVEIVEEFGIDAYPFTQERLDVLAEIEKAKLESQTLQSLLVSSDDDDFVIDKNGSKVLVSELEGKTVGLLFSVSSHEPCVEFTNTLVEVYNKLKDIGEKFEVVLISLNYEEDEFKKGLETIPWLVLPNKDKIMTKKLVRYFDVLNLPTLVILGPDGKTVNSNVAELVEEHGIDAYPFTQERIAALAEIEKAKLESQTLESLLVSGDDNFVIGKNGSKVPISELVGKNVVLYFSAHWCPPCRRFTPKLIKTYNEIKEKDDAFEVIFISSDSDQSSFEEYFSIMPWLALPFGDSRKKLLNRTFKVEGIPTAVAIGPSGRTVTKDVVELVMDHGAKAYPFTEEQLKHLEEQEEEIAKGWPEKLKHHLHPEHELKRAHRPGYCCDACEEMGKGWSFYCEECDFDLHPKCALEKVEEEGKNGNDAAQNGKEGFVCEGDVCRRV